MMMNNLHCSGVSESGAVAEMVFGLVLLSWISLTCDEDAVGVNVLLGVVPEFSRELSLLTRGERFRLVLLLWLSLSGFLLLPFVMLFVAVVVADVGGGGGDRRREDSDRFDFVSEDRFLDRLRGGDRERDVDLDLE